MRIHEVKSQQSKVEQLRKFAAWAIERLKIEDQPEIKYGNDLGHVKKNRTFGSTRSNGNIWVHVGNRNVADIMRTLCHELVHHKQFEVGTAYDGMDDEQTQQIEDEANAIAGRMMRAYGKKDETIYESKLPPRQGDPLSNAYTIPGLPNSDFYKQYRFGVALAGAKGKAHRDQEPEDLGASSAWGESLVVIGYGDDDTGKYIDDALRSIGMKPSDKKLTSTRSSQEVPDVGKISPVRPFKKSN